MVSSSGALSASATSWLNWTFDAIQSVIVQLGFPSEAGSPSTNRAAADTKPVSFFLMKSVSNFPAVVIELFPADAPMAGLRANDDRIPRSFTITTPRHAFGLVFRLGNVDIRNRFIRTFFFSPRDQAPIGSLERGMREP